MPGRQASSILTGGSASLRINAAERPILIVCDHSPDRQRIDEEAVAGSRDRCGTVRSARGEDPNGTARSGYSASVLIVHAGGRAMPVTAGPVPGLTQDLHRVPMDPGRFHSGRWFLFAEGVLVSAWGIAGLVAATQHPHAGATGVTVLGLTTTPVHSALLLALGAVAIPAAGYRRAAVTVTALSAVFYTILLFFSSVATARAKPTPLGLHAADIVLHGVLAVVNLALLMWLIPDELGDEVWAPRRGRGRGRRQPSDFQAVTEPTAVSTSAASATTADSPPAAPTAPAPESGVHRRLPRPAVSGQPSQPGPTNPNAPIPQSASAPTRGAVLPHAAVLLAAAGLTAVIGLAVWIRRRRTLRGSPS